MATFLHYRCTNPKCQFEIYTEPYGHYGLISGEYYEFRCAKCKDIYKFSTEEIAALRYDLNCPDCGAVLYSWNATDCKCPKCNSSLKDSDDITMMAD